MIDNYFSILQQSKENNLTGIIRIQLNPYCRVYEGHFPKEPVSPGVCNIEMIRKCAEAIHLRPIRFRKIKQCRLTALMTPHTTTQADIAINMQEMEPGIYRLTATIVEKEITYLTLKAEVADE